MKDILERLYCIGRAAIPRPKWMEKFIGPGISDKEFFNKFKEFYGYDPWDDTRGSTGNRSGYSTGTQTEDKAEAYPGIPRQVTDDLAVFDLKPPSSLAEVKKARNREIRKYHSDHFVNEPAKYETSKKIMQIYNAAYDRLKAYYESRGK